MGHLNRQPVPFRRKIEANLSRGANIADIPVGRSDDGHVFIGPGTEQFRAVTLVELRVRAVNGMCPDVEQEPAVLENDEQQMRLPLGLVDAPVVRRAIVEFQDSRCDGLPQQAFWCAPGLQRCACQPDCTQGGRLP